MNDNNFNSDLNQAFNQQQLREQAQVPVTLSTSTDRCRRDTYTTIQGCHPLFQQQQLLQR